MTNKNHEALVLAYKRAKAKSLKIKELNITPFMEHDDIEKLIIDLCKFKAKVDGVDDWSTYVKGQRWYVNSLVEFSGLTGQERLDAEYDSCFADVASEAELLAKLNDII